MTKPTFDIDALIDAYVKTMKIMVSDEATANGTGYVDVADVLAQFPIVKAGDIVAIVGAGTATINRYHTLGGTTYAFNLTTSGTVGDRVRFQCIASGIVSITPDGTDTIHGVNVAIPMIAGEWLELEDEGSGNWRVISTNITCRFEGTNTAATVLTGGTTNIPWTELIDTHGNFATATFIAPWTGIYKVSLSFFTGTGNAAGQAYIDTVADQIVGGSAAAGTSIGQGSISLHLTQGEALTIRSSGNVTLNSSAFTNFLTVVGMLARG